MAEGINGTPRYAALAHQRATLSSVEQYIIEKAINHIVLNKPREVKTRLTVDIFSLMRMAINNIGIAIDIKSVGTANALKLYSERERILSIILNRQKPESNQ